MTAAEHRIVATDRGARRNPAEFTAVLALWLVQAAVAAASVTAPFTEPAAYGRSCINATIARNYFEHGFRFFLPQLDYGPPPGYAALEFPLLPYMAAVMYAGVGVQDWVGRALAAVFGLALTIVIWLVARELTGSTVARVSSVLVAVLSPMLEFFARVFQSDSAMLFFVSLTVLLLFKNRRRHSGLLFGAACASCMLGMLLKPSSLVLLPALLSLMPADQPKWTNSAVAMAASAILPVAAYYVYAHHINAYGNLLGLAVVAQRATVSHMLQVGYEVQIAKDALQTITPAGCLTLAVGIPLAAMRRETWFVPMWAAGVVALDIVFNEAVSHHEYYQLLWVPIAGWSASIAVDYVVGRMRRRPKLRQQRWALIVVAALAVAASGWMSWRFLALRLALPASAYQRLDAASLLRDHTPPDALVAVQEIDLLYYSHRRGWFYGNDTGARVTAGEVAAIPSRGLQYLLVTNAEGVLSPEAHTYLQANAKPIASRDGAEVWLLRNPPSRVDR